MMDRNKIWKDGKWHCPLCNTTKRVDHKSYGWALSCGGSVAVCKKCAKEKATEIEEHNKIYGHAASGPKDPNCEHEWVHPYRSRFYCVKCGAKYSFVCGCGGSCYVCDVHYQEMMDDMRPTKEEYLAEHSW